MSQRKHKPLTGRHVWYWLIGFFGLMIVANTAFVYYAVTSFRGEDVPRSYRQGLEYNQTIETRREQNALGWRASYNTIVNAEGQTKLIVALTDQEGKRLTNLTITGTLRHPTDTNLDQSIRFTKTKPGQYKASESIPPGQWQLQATASQDQTAFNFRQDLWVK